MAANEEVPSLSSKERNVLEQLTSGDKYGMELVTSSGGLLVRSSVYVVLSRMEDKALIRGREQPTPHGESGPPRRLYKITGLGECVLEVHETALAVWRRRPKRVTTSTVNKMSREARRAFVEERALSAISVALADALVASGKSQREIAASLGLTETQVSQILSNEGDVTVRTLARVSDAVDCDLKIRFIKRPA